ncbi:MAG TPA: FAD/NAD(P)-binding protein [Steroidobacteraceae bacterium]|nr:FAD/NAD(P)-binding protein [Steroidobacteraceae bacterium]
MQSSARTIVIIGGGFSGTILAVNLLRRAARVRTRIVLMERSGRFGSGVAYAPPSRSCLLNVPAGRMSAVSEEPLQLVEFARRLLPGAGPDAYLPRELYGEYLRHLLAQAQAAAPPHLRLELVHAEAGGIHPLRSSGQWLVDADGHTWLADEVVLACGDPPPLPRAYAAAVEGHPGYVRNPHRGEWLRPVDEDVLLVGTGLTMADVAGSAVDRPALRLTALSRHGLLPAAQNPSAPTMLGTAPELLAGLETLRPRQVVATVRTLARIVVGQGGDWREVVTAVREVAPRLWQGWTETERRRFLRHVRAYWDVHRHRLPPSLAASLQSLRDSGRLQLHAGTLQQLAPAGERILARWRPRGGSASRERLFDRVIDCTGADHRLQRTQDGLLRQLLDTGLAASDPKGLGLRTGRHGALIGAGGELSAGLFYLGPMLRAAHWEATAVGELRRRAEDLAQRLCEARTPGGTASATGESAPARFGTAVAS